MAVARETWSVWFNIDNPRYGSDDGDFETVSEIQRNRRICSKGYDIVDSECQVSGLPNSTFSWDSAQPHRWDTLSQPCTNNGLICLNQDQQYGLCQDYRIRFRCRYNEDASVGTYFPQFDVRIYIVLAVVPVFIFLTRMAWTYVCRRRRQQRRTERRSQPRQDGARTNPDEPEEEWSSVASGLANPPPSYQDIFGKTAHLGSASSVFAISRDNIQICAQCESECCSVAAIIDQPRGRDVDGAGLQDSVTTASSYLEGDQDKRVGSPVSSGDLQVSSDWSTLSPGVGRDALNSMSDKQFQQKSEGVSNQPSATTQDQASAILQDHPVKTSLVTNTREPTKADTSSSITNIFVAETTEQTHLKQSTEQIRSESIPAIAVSAISVTSPTLPFQQTPQDLMERSSEVVLPLSPSSLHSSNISRPCPCPCHRTIPLKQPLATESYDNQGYALEGVDQHSTRPPSLPGMHIPALGLERTWSERSASPVDLPSYDIAVELMNKKKEEETEK